MSLVVMLTGILGEEAGSFLGRRRSEGDARYYGLDQGPRTEAGSRRRWVARGVDPSGSQPMWERESSFLPRNKRWNRQRRPANRLELGHASAGVFSTPLRQRPASASMCGRSPTSSKATVKAPPGAQNASVTGADERLESAVPRISRFAAKQTALDQMKT